MEMTYATLVLEKQFQDKISKEAYLKACKWLAKNVYSKDELANNVQVKITKTIESKLPTFTVSIFAIENYSEFKTNLCKKCQTISTIFYQVEKPNCDYCKVSAFDKNMEKIIRNKVKFLREVLEDEEDNE